jgi:hypothetical protein
LDLGQRGSQANQKRNENKEGKKGLQFSICNFIVDGSVIITVSL